MNRNKTTVTFIKLSDWHLELERILILILDHIRSSVDDSFLVYFCRSAPVLQYW